MTALPATPLREHLDFAETDTLLRDDVRRLGALVGEVLAEQGSQAWLDEVEGIRRAAIARREQGLPIDALAEELAVPLRMPRRCARSRRTGAINLAERVPHRRREYERSSDQPQPAASRRCSATCAMTA